MKLHEKTLFAKEAGKLVIGLIVIKNLDNFNLVRDHHE